MTTNPYESPKSPTPPSEPPTSSRLAIQGLLTGGIGCSGIGLVILLVSYHLPWRGSSIQAKLLDGLFDGIGILILLGGAILLLYCAYTWLRDGAND